MKLLKNLFRKFGTGALSDPRSREERLKDFKYEELATSIPAVEWREKPMTEWKSYPVRNQSQSGSCVGFSKALELGILNQLEEGEFVSLSARDIYTRRKNQGAAGMWGQDANQICIDKGATLETLMPSDNKNEEEINRIEDRRPHKEVIGKIFRAKSWIALPFNIDAIAHILSTGKGVNVFFRFAFSEWDRQVPVLTERVFNLHHSVVATDYTIWQGKKALIIQDSWGLRNTNQGRRVLTEDWISRLTWVSYFTDLSNWDLLKKEDLVKPKHVFKRDLSVGMVNEDVRILQDCLKWLDFFPKTQVSTGRFGGITRSAVKKFQTHYGIQPVLGFVGKLTRAKLNELFS